MKVSEEQAKKYADKNNIDYDVVSLKVFTYAMNVEMEHKNVTHGNLSKTADIVIAHLNELPDYYQRLKRLEKAGEKYWESKTKPSITTNKK